MPKLSFVITRSIIKHALTYHIHDITTKTPNTTQVTIRVLFLEISLRKQNHQSVVKHEVVNSKAKTPVSVFPKSQLTLPVVCEPPMVRPIKTTTTNQCNSGQHNTIAKIVTPTKKSAKSILSRICGCK